MEKVYWLSAVPANCQVCDGPLGSDVQHLLYLGPWDDVPGLVAGQKYVKQADGKWLKVEG